jgi:hypothetical protein
VPSSQHHLQCPCCLVWMFCRFLREMTPFLTSNFCYMIYIMMQWREDQKMQMWVYVHIDSSAIHPSTYLPHRCFHYCSVLDPPVCIGHQSWIWMGTIHPPRYALKEI